MRRRYTICSFLLTIVVTVSCATGSTEAKPTAPWREVGRGTSNGIEWIVFEAEAENGRCFSLELLPPPHPPPRDLPDEALHDGRIPSCYVHAVSDQPIIFDGSRDEEIAYRYIAGSFPADTAEEVHAGEGPTVVSNGYFVLVSQSGQLEKFELKTPEANLTCSVDWTSEDFASLGKCN